jgi:hypothetical protein
MRSLAQESADLAAVSRTYRFMLGARSMSHSFKGHHEMADFLAAGAEVAGELAEHYAERALWYSAVKPERV